jgi:DNA-binding HxlR family transcriptional regulator
MPAEHFGGDAGRPLVADHSRHDAAQGTRTYKTFLKCYEEIATNILADRLRKLAAHGIITTEPDPSDRRKVIYLLTKKGIDLTPVLTEMVLWAANHEDTGKPLFAQMRADKEKFLAGVR